MEPDIMEEGDNHIIILHSRCRRDYRDFYIADIISALLRNEKKVTVCTTEMNVRSPIINIEDDNHNLHFHSSWKHLPNSIFGRFELFFFQIKLISLLYSIMVTPLIPTPRIIITDMSDTAVLFLKYFTSCKVLYLKHFTNLHSGENFYAPLTLTPISTVARSLVYADAIIVQTECLKNMLQRCSPSIKNAITVLNPCYDTGFWLYDSLDVRSIVPMLPKRNFMFVVLSEFKVRSNLGLVLKAMDFIVRFTEITFSIKVHLVIAGYSQPLSPEENAFYKRLQEITAGEIYGNNVSFVKRTSVLEQKTLIENCTAVINPTHYNAFPGSILMAMNMKKPILSVDNGFAAQVLVDQVTGFMLHNHPSIFGTKMEELAKTPEAGEEVVRNAKREFDENYSFQAYSRLLNQIIDHHLNS